MFKFFFVLFFFVFVLEAQRVSVVAEKNFSLLEIFKYVRDVRWRREGDILIQNNNNYLILNPEEEQDGRSSYEVGVFKE